jgi:hypothetical protein
VATGVPEPASVTLLLAGVVGIGAGRARRMVRVLRVPFRST